MHNKYVVTLLPLMMLCSVSIAQATAKPQQIKPVKPPVTWYAYPLHAAAALSLGVIMPLLENYSIIAPRVATFPLQSWIHTQVVDALAQSYPVNSKYELILHMACYKISSFLVYRQVLYMPPVPLCSIASIKRNGSAFFSHDQTTTQIPL